MRNQMVFTGDNYTISQIRVDDIEDIIADIEEIPVTIYKVDRTQPFKLTISNLIPKKYFTQTKKKQAKLGGIYFGMILGSVAFFAILIMLLYGIQTEFLQKHYNMFSKTFNADGDFTYIPIIISSTISSTMFVMLFAVSIVTFFILNTDLQNKKKIYNGDNKSFYTDMFRMFYIVLMISFVLLILFTEANTDKIPKF